MKKIFVFLAIVIMIVSIVGVKYYSYKTEYNAIMKENEEYEKYKDKEIYGTDIVTIINKAIDKNIKNKIEKNDEGNFIQNDIDSIEIEIYMADNEKTYKMEQIYNSGTEQFLFYYRDLKFKCSNIEYHQNTGKVKYILFEQLENS